jgi:class 3 adenylate cyclase
MFSMAMTRSVHNNAPDALAFVHRVESAGAAGKITVSEAIYHRTKDLFDFEPRGGVEVDLMSLRGISSAVALYVALETDSQTENLA